MSILAALRLTRAPGAAFLVMGLFWGVFAAHVPVLKARLGVDDALFGVLLLSSALGLLSAMWLAPRFDARLGSRAMPVAAAFLALVWIGPGVATTPLAFALCMVGVGLGSGLLDVVMNARVSEIEAREGRSLMNANHGLFSLAYALAALASGVTREAGLPVVMVLGAVACLSVLLTTQMRTRTVVEETPELRAAPLPLGPVWLCGVVVLVAFMSEATVESWSALHVERTLGGRAAEGALGPAMLGVTMALGRFGGQLVAERMRETTVILAAALLSSGGAVIVAAAPGPSVAYLGFATLGLGISVIGPMGLALAGRMVAPHLRTRAISRVAVIGFGGFFIAPLLMGGLSELFGLRVAFGAVALLLLLILPPALALRRLARPIARAVVA